MEVISNIINEILVNEFKRATQLIARLKKNTSALQDANEDTIRSLTIALKKVLTNDVAVKLKCRLNTAVLICDLLSCAASGTNTNLFRTFTEPVCEFTLELLVKHDHESTLKNRHLLLTLLSALKKCIIIKAIAFRNIPNSLVKQIVNLAVVKDASKELHSHCLMLLIAGCVLHTDAWKAIVKMFFEVIGYETHNILGVTINVENVKITRFSLFILVILQNLLENSYENCFMATMYIVKSLTEACKTPQYFDKFSPLLEKLVYEILALSSNLLWPVTGVILPIISRVIATDLNSTVSADKYRILALKIVTNFGVEIGKNDDNYRKLDRMFAAEFKHTPGRLQDIIICVASNMRAADINGDVLKAYKCYWSRLFPNQDASPNSSWANVTAVDAEAAKYFIDFKNHHILTFVKYLLNGCKHETKMVRSAAVKGLGRVLVCAPRLLLNETVYSIMVHNLDGIAAQARESFAQVLGSSVLCSPSTLRNRHQTFIKLLNDPAKTVRRASAKTITTAFTKMVEQQDCALPLAIISLFESAEDSDKQVALAFFSTVWLECKQLRSLVDISKNIYVSRKIHQILNKLRSEASRQSELMESIESKVCSLANGLADYLEVNKLAIVNLFLIISKEFPKALSEQIPKLAALLFEDTSDLQLMLTKILINFGKGIKDLVIDLEKDVAEALGNFNNGSTINFIYLIKLMLLLVEDSTSFKKITIYASARTLITFYEAQLDKKRISFNKNDLTMHLCKFVYLFKHFYKDPKNRQMIYFFLRSADFSSPALLALGEARREHIPAEVDEELVAIITEFLGDEANIRRVLASLEYLQCLLTGYAEIVQSPDMKAVGDSTTEHVSYTLQHCLQPVTKCSLSTNDFVRRAACKVMFYVATSGLVLPKMYIPTLVAMTTDSNLLIRTSAEKWLNSQDRWRHGSFIPSLYECYTLAQVLNPNHVIRGFDSETYHSTCIIWLKLVQKSGDHFRALMRDFFNEIEKTQDLYFAVFVLDQLVYMLYKTVAEVDFFMHLIEKTISTLPSGMVDKLCYLKKAEDFVFELYKLPKRTSIGKSPNNKGEVSRKGQLFDFLPLLERNRHAIKIEEDSPDMNIPLAELRKRLAQPVVVVRRLSQEEILRVTDEWEQTATVAKESGGNSKKRRVKKETLNIKKLKKCKNTSVVKASPALRKRKSVEDVKTTPKKSKKNSTEDDTVICSEQQSGVDFCTSAEDSLFNNDTVIFEQDTAVGNVDISPPMQDEVVHSSTDANHCLPNFHVSSKQDSPPSSLPEYDEVPEYCFSGFSEVLEDLRDITMSPIAKEKTNSWSGSNVSSVIECSIDAQLQHEDALPLHMIKSRVSSEETPPVATTPHVDSQMSPNLLLHTMKSRFSSEEVPPVPSTPHVDSQMSPNLLLLTMKSRFSSEEVPPVPSTPHVDSQMSPNLLLLTMKSRFSSEEPVAATPKLSQYEDALPLHTIKSRFSSEDDALLMRTELQTYSSSQMIKCRVSSDEEASLLSPNIRRREAELTGMYPAAASIKCRISSDEEASLLSPNIRRRAAELMLAGGMSPAAASSRELPGLTSLMSTYEQISPTPQLHHSVFPFILPKDVEVEQSSSSPESHNYFYYASN